MPLYELSVTTNVQSSEGDAVTSSVEVDEGFVEEGLIFIDPGSNGEVRAQLRFGDRSLLPASESGFVSVPANRAFVPINFVLPGSPNDIELRAWAPDADFTHEVIAQFTAVEGRKQDPLDRIAGLIGRAVGGSGRRERRREALRRARMDE